MTDTDATGYDCLSARLIPESELRTFLLDCFGIGAGELFVGRDDQVADATPDIAQDVVFSVFCTYGKVFGHFALRVAVGVEGRLADRVGRQEFAERFAAHFDTCVLYGDTEPPGLWTVVSADGSRIRAAMDEEDDRYVLYAATAPVPGLPEVPVDEGL
ncbi:hypothetical protein [Nocardia sp. NBC_00416]|uniref:hypothetical protein n=1 Tax=Nocardia sp. NBC_00416 TaxID=2975991 RepID=UPI002E1F3878